MTVSAGARPAAVPIARGRRLTVLLLAAVLAAGGCRGTRDDGSAAATSSDASDTAAAEVDPAAAPTAGPAPGARWTAEDSIRAVREDSIHEAQLMRTRQAAMDSYAGCIAKAKGADPQQRAVLEAACQHARGAPAGAPPR